MLLIKSATETSTPSNLFLFHDILLSIDLGTQEFKGCSAKFAGTCVFVKYQNHHDLVLCVVQHTPVINT